MPTDPLLPRPSRRLFVACAGSAILIRAARADALSDGRFRDEVTAILRTVRPGAVILPDPDPAQLKVDRFTIALTNLYPRVAPLAGTERRQAIEGYLNAFLKTRDAAATAGMPGFAAAKQRLRVQLLPRAILTQVPDLANRNFSETLIVAYVLDEANRYQYVTRSMLDRWGADGATVEATALSNLQAASKDAAFGLALADGVPVLAMAATGDNYDAARLMLPRYLDDIRTALKTDSLTLAVPTRDLLMAWPADSKARAGMAGDARAQMLAGPYARSDELFRFDRNGLRPLTAAERADHGR